MRSVEHLIQCIYLDLLPSEPSTLADYFTMESMENDHICSIILGVYQKMVKCYNIDANMLHNACINHKLNKLIHSTYKNRETGYYKLFCDMKIDVDE